MLKSGHIAFLLLLVLLLDSCTSSKNTAATRWYHSFNTRYNVFFNGNQAYKEAFKAQQEGYTENYTETILMFPVSSLPKEKPNTGGPFDKAIEKSVKSIKTHSIQTKPEKKSGKRNDPKYREFMSRTEYNPFLYKAWLLMAQSQFQNGDFLQSASSFSYISRLYSTQPGIANEAMMGQARCYAEMGWYFEANEILSKIDQNALSKKQSDWLATIRADLLIKQKQYQEAIPYLQTAIKSEKNKLQKAREKYLLGQIYARLGENDLAYKTFGEVSRANVPYILEFSAKIRQTEVYSEGDNTKVIKQLRKMSNSSKNKDYLDQVYYALGNVYMSIPDTIQAIASYEKGVEESTLNGIDKAFNQIQLGDIYFEQRKYVLAQPNYSEALGQLKKEDVAYPRVSKRSEVLDELVVFHEAVELQDSLLRLSKMSEVEQLVIIDKIIEDLIKREKEEQKKSEREEFLSKREEIRPTMGMGAPSLSTATGAAVAPADANLFYFYNPQVVAVGKSSFQQKWGRRKQEDDWRRKNKTNPLSDLFAEEEGDEMDEIEGDENQEESDMELTDENGVELSFDTEDPQFYLQQIPKTEEDIEAANLIIEDGLFNMAVVYKDKLEDASLALETFEVLDTRFPENENKLMAYYHTYLIYLRKGDMEMANLYKQKIRLTFPESEYAIAMADPDYEQNLRMMDVIPDSIYQDTYDAYLSGNVSIVRENYEQIVTKYNQSKLMPKFMFLNALSYVQTNDSEAFKEQLKNLIDKYADADVSVLAAEMMKGFQRGLLLSASGDGMLARGSLFNIRFGGENEEFVENDSLLTFSAEVNTPSGLLLIYPHGNLNDNLLLYTVASYNFGNFRVNDFELEQTVVGEISIFQIKGFDNLEQVLQYVHMAHQPEGYAQGLEQEVIFVPISIENYTTLMKGKSLEEYMNFFEENYGTGNQNLIDRWKLRQQEELKVIQEDVEEKTDDPKEIVKEKESIEPEELIVPEVQTPDITPINPPEQEEPVDNMISGSNNEMDEKIDDTYNQASDTMDDLNSKMDEIANDPVRGILNLFKRKPSNAIDEFVKQQEQEEKERQKELKKEQQAKEKEARELAKQQEKEEKERLKQKREEEKVLLKEKEDEKKKIQQAKEDEKKQKKEEQKLKQKQREDERKLKEKERKEAQKKKEEERKAKEKARKEAQKQKAAERKAKQK